MEAAETDISRTKPVALFMAFGTQGDVYPIAAIAAAFACDEELRHYHVVLMTHSAHKNLIAHLASRNVEFLAVTTPPVLSPFEGDDPAGTVKPVFSMQKRRITKEHRQECISNVEQIFGDGPSLEDDFIVINFFALEGWSLAELFHVRCFVAAPYVVPYSAPSSFERYFKKELPLLYKYLQEAPNDKVGWKDVIHWLWPLFTEDWGIWRSVNLKLSAWPFTVYTIGFHWQDPVTGLPMWHDRPQSPLLLYGFSKEVVECPGYWPPNVRVSGFWFLPLEWQLSCNKCGEVPTSMSSEHNTELDDSCPAHVELKYFLRIPVTSPPVFIGLSSVGSMGFLRNPQAFLGVLRTVVEITSHRFILISAGFEPLNAAIHDIAVASSGSEHIKLSEEATSLFSGRVFYFSGFIPYKWLFPRCAAAVHHGGSGSTAAALHAGIPQVICPFMLDQFYWAERMNWLGVAPEPLKRNHLVPEETDDASIIEAANKLAKAIDVALSSKVKARASEVAERLAVEDGVSEAVKILKKEINSSKAE